MKFFSGTASFSKVMLLGLALEAAMQQLQVNWQHKFQGPAVFRCLRVSSAGPTGDCQEASLLLISLGITREAE